MQKQGKEMKLIEKVTEGRNYTDNNTIQGSKEVAAWHQKSVGFCLSLSMLLLDLVFCIHCT